jgi:phage I-like protein
MPENFTPRSASSKCSPDATQALSPVLCAAQPLANSGADAPAFVHLLPANVVRTRDGRGPYRLTDPTAVIARSLPAGSPPLPLDENHSMDHAARNGAPSPARGWIVELQARANGVWGRVEWTPEGRAMVAGRAYRHISPVILHDPQNRVMRILRASVVNDPNFVDLVALNAAQRASFPETTMDMTKLREALGLPADADEAAILAAIAQLTENGSSGRPDPTKWVSIEDFRRAVAEANKLRQGVSLNAAEERVASDIRNGLILPWMKDWAVELCMTSAPSYEKFMDGVGPGFSHLLRAQIEDGKSRGWKAPGSRPKEALTDEEKSVASRLGHSDDAFAAARD